jgi:hypothetical protein
MTAKGYRHAVTLLLANGLKALPSQAPPALVAEVLTRLARDLVALADDMRVLPDEAAWTSQEYSGAVDRTASLFSHRADGDLAHVIEHTRTRATEILSDIGKHRSPDTGRDLFLLYVPEDRLPLAAPLAIELTKRRFTVAFSDYEVDTPDQMLQRREQGLERHLAGLFLDTPAIARRRWTSPLATDRFRVGAPGSPEIAVDALCQWLGGIRKLRKDSQISPPRV